jgi:hypothetical protein
MKCEHYKGDGFHYLNWKLLICDKCERRLRKEILKQIELEDELIGITEEYNKLNKENRTK